MDKKGTLMMQSLRGAICSYFEVENHTIPFIEELIMTSFSYRS